MPTLDYLPAKDSALAAWLVNFAQQAGENLDELPITQAQVDAIAAQSSALKDANMRVFVQKAIAEGATAARAAVRAQAVQDARILVKLIQAQPGLSDDLRAKLRITIPRKRRKKVPVFTPEDVNLAIVPPIRVALSWNKSGNSYGTQYVIERRQNGAGDFVMIGQTTTTRFVDNTCAPGTPTTYRVTALRGSEISVPSFPVSVY